MHTAQIFGKVNWRKRIISEVMLKCYPTQYWLLIKHSKWDIFFHGPSAPSGPRPPHYRGFMITIRYTELGRTPLDEWSARRRNLYLITHNTQNRQTSTVPVGIRTRNPSKRPAAHRRLRPPGHWRLHSVNILFTYVCIIEEFCHQKKNKPNHKCYMVAMFLISNIWNKSSKCVL